MLRLRDNLTFKKEIISPFLVELSNMKSLLSCALAQVINCLPVTEEALFQSWVSLCGIYGGNVTLGFVYP